MRELFTNPSINYFTLAAQLNAGATSLTLSTNPGTDLPAPGANEFFRLIIRDDVGQSEEVIITSRTGATCTLKSGTTVQNTYLLANNPKVRHGAMAGWAKDIEIIKDGSGYNPLHYGAAGNGTADDSAAFAAMLADIPSYGGRIILPAGRVFRIPSGISEGIPNLVVEGYTVPWVGSGSDYPGNGGSWIKAENAAAWAWKHINNEGSTTNDYRGPIFRGVGFMGDSDTAGGLKIESANARVYDCMFAGHIVGVGFQLSGRTPITNQDDVSWSRLEGCTALNNLIGFQAGMPNQTGWSALYAIGNFHLLNSAGGIQKKNGSKGFLLYGGVHFLTNNKAEEADIGFHVRGVQAILSGNFSEANGKYFTVTTVAANTTVTATSGTFVADDVGKLFTIKGGGTNGEDLITSIASVTDSTHAVLTNAPQVAGSKDAWAGAGVYLDKDGTTEPATVSRNNILGHTNQDVIVVEPYGRKGANDGEQYDQLYGINFFGGGGGFINTEKTTMYAGRRMDTSVIGAFRGVALALSDTAPNAADMQINQITLRPLSNTQVNIYLKGTDGTMRSVTLTLT